MLIRIRADKISFDVSDYESMAAEIKTHSYDQLLSRLDGLLNIFVEKEFQQDKGLLSYLRNDVPDFTIELINGAMRV